MLAKFNSQIVSSVKNRKINVFFMFLLLAVVILIFSKLSKDYTKTMAFPIEKINVPQEAIILKDSVFLNITLKTNGFNWLRLYLDEPKIKIDFKKEVTQSEKVFIWNKSKSYLAHTQFNNNIELLNVYPERIEFKYGINMVKKVPVKLMVDVQFAAGYESTNPVNTYPDSVVVVGPKVIVDKINSVQTAPVTLKEVNTNISKKIKLKLPHKNFDVTYSSEQITLKGQVEKFTEGTLKVPITIRNVPENIKLKYFPREVNVTYYVSLSNFNAISKNDFEIICDYNKVLKNQFLMVPELIKYPEIVKNVKINHQHIEFIILE